MLHRQLVCCLWLIFLPHWHHLPTTVFHAKKILGLRRTTNLAIGPTGQLLPSSGGRNHTNLFHRPIPKVSWRVATSFSNADEISKADGNEEKAKTVKQKASENVSGLFNTINPLAWYTHTSNSTNISTTKADMHRSAYFCLLFQHKNK